MDQQVVELLQRRNPLSIQVCFNLEAIEQYSDRDCRNPLSIQVCFNGLRRKL